MLRPTCQLHRSRSPQFAKTGPPRSQKACPHKRTNQTNTNRIKAALVAVQQTAANNNHPGTRFPPKATLTLTCAACDPADPSVSMAASSSEAATATPTTTVGLGGSGTPGPPPPTPSNHHAAPSSAAGGATDASLSAFLHRLLLSSPAPQLRSPLAARSQASPPSLPPLVSLESPDQRALRNAADVGYFHLAGHGIPSGLPSSALAELSRIDASTRLESNLRTLGFSVEEGEEQDVDGGADDPAVVFDACEGDLDALPAAAEYARRMKDVGMRVVALLSGCPDTGFREKPFAEGRRKPRCLLWASRVSTADTAPPAVGKAKAYPYVVALHCQWEASGQEEAPPSWVMNHGGEWTAVAARDDAMLVTVGDIAQVQISQIFHEH